MSLSIQAPGCFGSENNKDQSHDCHTDTRRWQGGFLKHRNQRSLKSRIDHLILSLHNKSDFSNAEKILFKVFLSGYSTESSVATMTSCSTIFETRLNQRVCFIYFGTIYLRFCMWPADIKTISLDEEFKTKHKNKEYNSIQQFWISLSSFYYFRVKSLAQKNKVAQHSPLACKRNFVFTFDEGLFYTAGSFLL